jgi:2-keto-3-deoxy-L-rhamnonate aldolase RhmA
MNASAPRLTSRPDGFRGSGPFRGLWRIIPSPQLTEAVALAGFDFQILDCEHGAYDYGSLLTELLACERHGCAALVRVSGRDPVEVQRCLDLGARGLVFPQLATVDDFARAAAMLDYAPTGTRGFNPFVRAGGYGAARGEPRPWFVPIVETLTAVEQLGAILALRRIDLVYVGSYDLSAQLGCPGQMEAPELLQTVARVFAACRAAGVPAAAMAPTPAAEASLAAQGVQTLVHGVESHLLREALAQLIATRTPRAHPPATPGSARG